MEVIQQENIEIEPENFLGKRSPQSETSNQDELTEPCVFCFKNEGIYRCTGCHLKLCSPLCINEHKKLVNPSDGVKNVTGKLPQPLNIQEYFLSKTPIPCSKQNLPTAFIPRNSLNKRVLLRDFSYLSDVMENTSHVKKKLSLLSNNMQKQKEMMRFKILKTNAKKRGISIEYAPIFMRRHRENISFWYTKDKIMFWVLEFKLEMGQSQPGDFTRKFKFHNVVIQPQCEEKQFSEILQDVNWNDAKIVEWLGYGYQGWQDTNKGFGQLKFFIENTFNKEEVLKCDEIDTEIKQQVESDQKLIELRLDLTLKNLLWHLKLVEFPSIFVVQVDKVTEFKLKYKNDKLKRERHSKLNKADEEKSEEQVNNNDQTSKD